MTQSSHKPSTPKQVQDQPSFMVWIAWFMTASFYMYQFILRVAPGVLSEDLTTAFNVDSCELGHLGSAYYRSYALMQIPIGFMLDRFGAKKLISISCLCAAGGTLIFGMAPNLDIAYVGRLLMGIGASCGFIGTVKLSNILFPPERIARAIGITMVMGTVGASIGGMPLGAAADHFGWRDALISIGIGGIVLAILIYIVLTQSIPTKNQPLSKTKDHITKKTGLLESFAQVIKRPQIWLVGIYGSLLYVPLAAIADLWGVPFLTTSYNLTKNDAAVINSLIYYGVAVGSPIAAYICEKRKSRKFPMYISAILSLSVYSLLIIDNSYDLRLLYALFFVGGLAFCGQSMVFSIISESLPHNLTGLGLGFINTIIMCSGVIFEPLIGYIIRYSVYKDRVFDMNNLSFSDFQMALLPIPLCMIAALALLQFIRETFGKSTLKR